MSLIAELRGQACFLRYFFQKPCLPNVMSQGLLTINMLSCPHGHERNIGMGMIRSRADDGVQRLFFLHHLPEVNVFRHLEVGRFLSEMFLYHLFYRTSTRFKPVVKIGEIPVVRRISNGCDLHIVKLKKVFRILTSFAARTNN